MVAMDESGDTPAWNHLMDVGGLEVILGPLQERVTVGLCDRGFVLTRSGLAGSIFGAYEEFHSYADIQPVSGGRGVWVSDEQDERPAHHIVGTAGRLLRLLVEILDDERTETIVAAPGRATTRLGLLVRGMMVGGPKGI